MGTKLIFPENGDVGNAIGAVCSKIVVSMTGTIYPTMEGMFRTVVPMSDQRYVKTLNEAIAIVKSQLEKVLMEDLRRDGAQNTEIIFKVRTYSMTDDGLWTENDLDHADVIARATGDPKGM